MENKEIKCNEAELLMESKLDGELDEAGKAALDAHVTTCEKCRDELEKLEKTEALLKDGAEIPPETLYTSVMSKIKAEKKNRAAFIRRLGTACAAAFVFIMASVMLLPRFADGIGVPDAISFHGTKANDGESSKISGDSDGPIILGSLLSDAKLEIGGTTYELAGVQVGRIALVCENGGYVAYDLDDGARIQLSDLTDKKSDSGFKFTEQGILLEDGSLIPWGDITDEVKDKYDMTMSPVALDRAKDVGYKLIAIK